MALAKQSASLYQCPQLQNGGSKTTSLGCYRIEGNDIWKVFSPLPEDVWSLFHIYIPITMYTYIPIDICQYISIYTNTNQYLIIVIHFLFTGMVTLMGTNIRSKGSAKSGQFSQQPGSNTLSGKQTRI